MEDKKLDYDSDIIYCENVPETILVTSSPEKSKSKKHKKKKRKPKVKRQVYFNHMENLLITKLHVKKAKFKCVININRVCERSDSIVRSDSNVCKKEAYYHRILPVCLRSMCQKDIARSRCMVADKLLYKEEATPNSDLSPVSSRSSVALTDMFGCSNLTYDDISNGEFSSASEEELDTLIKRTKQREKHFEQLNSSRRYASTPISEMDDIPSPSPYSVDNVDMDKSIHSDTTMILNPLSIEAYSPNALDAFKIANSEHDPNMFNKDALLMPNSKNEKHTHMNRYNSCDQDKHSPTYTQESMEIENDSVVGSYSKVDRFNVPYSTFSPDLGSYNTYNVTEYASYYNNANDANYTNDAKDTNDTMVPFLLPIAPNLIEIELNKSPARTNAYDATNAYSPSSPTLSPDLDKMKKTNYTYNQNDYPNNGGYSLAINTKRIKEENIDEQSATLISKFIKEERDIPSILNATDYNMNQTYKKEKKDIQSETIDNQEVSKIMVKVEKDYV